LSTGLTPAGAYEYQHLRHDVGMWLGAKNIDSVFYINSKVSTVFKKYTHLRKDMPDQLPTDFDPIVADIHKYIRARARGGAEARNKVSHAHLARSIVRASFCFGTDPYMTTAKVHIESVFDRSVISPTGAVGFSQMTGPGIEEVNDQFGSRGNKHVPATNPPIFKRAAACYMGKSKKWVNMWEGQGVMAQGQRLGGSRLNLAKKWLRASLDRDVVYGQVLLKVNLAASYASGRSMLSVYRAAFVRYNGDMNWRNGRPMKEVYADQVLGYFRRIGFIPAENAPEQQPFRDFSKDPNVQWDI
jgi:hypothetical protein